MQGGKKSKSATFSLPLALRSGLLVALVHWRFGSFFALLAGADPWRAADAYLVDAPPRCAFDSYFKALEDEVLARCGKAFEVGDHPEIYRVIRLACEFLAKVAFQDAQFRRGQHARRSPVAASCGPATRLLSWAATCSHVPTRC